MTACVYRTTEDCVRCSRSTGNSSRAMIFIFWVSSTSCRSHPSLAPSNIQIRQSRAPVASDLSSSLAYLARLPPLETRAAPACTCVRTDTITNAHIYTCLPTHIHSHPQPHIASQRYNVRKFFETNFKSLRYKRLELSGLFFLFALPRPLHCSVSRP